MGLLGTEYWGCLKERASTSTSFTKQKGKHVSFQWNFPKCPVPSSILSKVFYAQSGSTAGLSNTEINSYKQAWTEYQCYLFQCKSKWPNAVNRKLSIVFGNTWICFSSISQFIFTYNNSCHSYCVLDCILTTTKITPLM